MKIDIDSLDEQTRAFLTEHSAEGGHFHVSRTETADRVALDVLLSNGKEPVDVPPGVRGQLIMAASRADGVMSSNYEFSAPRSTPTQPRRREFPDTAEGGRQYMRALGAYHASVHEVNSGKGLPPPATNDRRMSRSAFEALEPAAKLQAMRDRVNLYD